MSDTQKLQIDSLVDFREHVFKPYSGERLKELTDSIRESGVLLPIIVRPIADGKYEILSGHNRRTAAREAGLTEIPAVIMHDLSDDEAKLVVTETNLIQRSFSDLLPSEKAKSLIMHYQTAKHQGKRTDLIDTINRQLSAKPGRPKGSTSRHSGEKLETDKETAIIFGISARGVSRYIKLKDLSDGLFELLDKKQIPLLAAVELAFIGKRGQNAVESYFSNDEFVLTVDKAKALRKYAEEHDGKLTKDDVARILSGTDNEAPIPAVRLSAKTLSRFFSSGQSQEEIEDEIIKALEAYQANNSE